MRDWKPPLLAAVLVLVAIACAQEETPAPGTSNGVIHGSVNIGPLCPVEPCDRQVGDLYSSRVLILRRDSSEPRTAPLAPNGSFYAEVPAGNYSVELSQCDFLGCTSVLPVHTSVGPKGTTTLDIRIDTGIRVPVTGG